MGGTDHFFFPPFIVPVAVLHVVRSLTPARGDPCVKREMTQRIQGGLAQKRVCKQGL